jgi:hypothetical protein
MRLIMLPFMALFEGLLLAVCYMLGRWRVKVHWALAINEWSKKLPELDWYLYHSPTSKQRTIRSK